MLSIVCAIQVDGSKLFRIVVLHRLAIEEGTRKIIEKGGAEMKALQQIPVKVGPGVEALS